MNDGPTCGQGLAENSVLPAQLGELLASMADILQLHRNALDMTDSHSAQEDEAYRKLEQAVRTIATDLRTAANDMAGYRDLPMGRHDPRLMASPQVVAAFDTFVRHEQQLLELVQSRLDEDRRLLAEMQAMRS